VSIAIHLVVDGDAIPACGNGEWRLCLIENGGDSVEGDGLVCERVVAVASAVYGDVIPGVGGWLAGIACGLPVLIDVVPQSPYVAADDAAFGTDDDADGVEEPVGVELKGFCMCGVIGADVELGVVGEVSCSGGDGMRSGIGLALRGACADEVVHEDDVRVWDCAAEVELCGFAADGRRRDSEVVGVGDARTVAGVCAVGVGGSFLPGHEPTGAGLQTCERCADGGDGNGSGGRPAAVVPGLHRCLMIARCDIELVVEGAAA